MNISSRTPEGEPNRCPICSADIRLEPSQPFGDAPCPCCGHLLWFISAGAEQRFYAGPGRESMRDKVIRILADQLSVPAEQVRAAFDQGESGIEQFKLDGMNSLDMVELIMELEEESEPPQ